MVREGTVSIEPAAEAAAAADMTGGAAAQPQQQQQSQIPLPEYGSTGYSLRHAPKQSMKGKEAALVPLRGDDKSTRTKSRTTKASAASSTSSSTTMKKKGSSTSTKSRKGQKSLVKETSHTLEELSSEEETEGGAGKN
jgi:hypothetical protein